MARPYNIQIRLTVPQVNALLDLLEDELETGEPGASDRPPLEGAKRAIERGLASLDARLERMASYGKEREDGKAI